MAKKSNVATFIKGDKKYSILSNTIVKIEQESGSVFEGLRVTGMNRMGDCIRCVSADDGIVEIPINTIKTIIDTENADDPNFSGVTVSDRR